MSLVPAKKSPSRAAFLVRPLAFAGIFAMAFVFALLVPGAALATTPEPEVVRVGYY